KLNHYLLKQVDLGLRLEVGGSAEAAHPSDNSACPPAHKGSQAGAWEPAGKPADQRNLLKLFA
ncbi:MAG: hypothetical protein WAW37_04540, partial [Syntrophobacteraceae bacterium]